MELDAESSNTLWSDAIKKEIDSLFWLGCIEFHAPDFKPSLEYQFAKLTIMGIFEVKQPRWAMQSQTCGWQTYQSTEGYQLPIHYSEGHQCPIA